MALTCRSIRSSRVTAVLALSLVPNPAPLATFAAVMPEITADWSLTASEAGWIGGIYFAGYTASVSVLWGATDGIDGRWVFACRW